MVANILVNVLGYGVFTPTSIELICMLDHISTDHFHYQLYKAFYFSKAGGTFWGLISDAESLFLSLKPRLMDDGMPNTSPTSE